MLRNTCLGTATGRDVNGAARSLTIFRARQGFYLSGDAWGGRTHPSIGTLDALLEHVALRFRLEDVEYRPLA